MSFSSDYFDDDPEFVRALAEVPLPGEDSNEVDTHTSSGEVVTQEPESDDGMPPSTQPCLKRRRTPDSDDEAESDIHASNHTVLLSVDQDSSKAAYLDSHTYGAAHLGTLASTCPESDRSYRYKMPRSMMTVSIPNKVRLGYSEGFRYMYV